VQAKAWHHAVVTNSPVAYKSFYEKYSNSPNAQDALKLAEKPKIIPLSQPTQIMAPGSIKLGGFGMGKENYGPNLGKFGHSGQIVTLHAPGKNVSSGISGIGSGKITNLPAGGLNKMNTSQNSKLGGGLSRVGHQPSKSLSPIKTNQRFTGISRNNVSAPPKFRQQGMSNAGGGSNFRFASSQGRTGGGMGGGMGGGGFGGGRFGR
jgi:hypothetical protein